VTIDRHPLAFARHLAHRYGGDLTLSFSRYFYRPNSIFDERSTFSVEAGMVNEEWLYHELSSLPAGWELAFNSVVKDRRQRTHHIGMIDFAEGATAAAIRDAVHRLLGDAALRSLWLYSSGRSFHGYFSEMMRPGEWREFLGRSLLMNELGMAPVVDARWVGHRLVGGYCALRWSMNTQWYNAMPQKVWPASA
jgi:hypothetical protein